MHYYPIAFSKLYPMAPTILNLYRQCTNNKAIASFDTPATTEETSFWEPLYRFCVQTQDISSIDRNWFAICVFNQVTNWANWGAWYLGGAMIFSLHPEVAKEFLETNVEGLRLEDVNLPNEQIYLHWGQVEGLGTVDGCFVYNTEDSLYLCPTEFDPTADYEKPINWTEELQSVVDYQLKKEWDINYDFLYLQIKDNIEGWKDSSFYGADVEFIKKMDKFVIKAYETFQAYLLPLLRLVITSLLYLTAEPDDVTPEWDGIPEELIQEWKNAPLNKRKRVTQKINKLGYRQINFVGRKLAQPPASRHSSNGSKKGLHKRRGHPRKQACGKGWKERKLVWISDVWINKNDDEAIVPRVYDVAERPHD